MTVLITRPEEESAKLKQILDSINIPSIIEPMFHVKHSEFKLSENDIKNIDQFIFTSKNALSAIDGFKAMFKNKECFVIGPETQKAAEDFGFSKIYCADSRMDTLIALIQKHAKSGKDILYVCGEKVSFDLQRHFKGVFKILNLQVYSTVSRTNFSDELIKKLKDDIKIILFYSRNTAETFMNICEARNITGLLKNVKFFVISDAIRTYLNKKIIYNGIFVFENNADKLINLIKKDYEK